MRRSVHSALAALSFALFALAPARACAAPPAQRAPATHEAAYWIGRDPHAHAERLTPAAIAALNARTLREDRSLHALSELPATLDAATVRGWITSLSVRPGAARYLDGRPVDAALWERWQAALALDRLPPMQPTRFAVVTRRTPVRTFPTRQRVLARPDDGDIDRFQETALFLGTPVVIAHVGADPEWAFVVAPDYAGWVARSALAEAPRDDALAFASTRPRLWVTGAHARTATTPEQPSVSAVPLEMGMTLPLQATGDPAQAVNGQSPASAWTVALPVRNADGRLHRMPALVPHSMDVDAAPVPFTAAGLLRQAFKFLGERYGWGHDYDARDCSGFVREVYASMGIVLPRNTGDQARSPAFARWPYGRADAAQRRAALAAVQPGDLLYLPGHVMLVIGHDDAGGVWVIHDVQQAHQRGDDGRLRRVPLNGVVVSALDALHLADGTPYRDRLTTVVRVGGSLAAFPRLEDTPS